MKANITHHAAKATLFSLVLIAVGLFGSLAHAQSEIQGKFTLPYEVHWGQAVLPPGDYLLGFQNTPFTTAVIRDAVTLRPVAFEPVVIREDSKGGESALLIGTRGEHRTVYSLRIEQLGETFVYDPPLARAKAIEEAHHTNSVPVLMAAK